MSQSESIQYIHDVCDRWLDNADLYELSLGGNGVTLKFVVGGTDKLEFWVDVQCRGVHVFNVSKDPDESTAAGIFVGGARVVKFEGKADVRKVLESAGWTWYEQLPEQAYQLEVEGSIEIKVICIGLSFTERKEKTSG